MNNEFVIKVAPHKNICSQDEINPKNAVYTDNKTILILHLIKTNSTELIDTSVHNSHNKAHVTTIFYRTSVISPSTSQHRD